MSFINMSTNLSLAAVLFVGGGLIAKNKMTPGGLTKFAMQSVFVGLGFSGLSTFYSDMTKSLDAAKRVFDTLDENNKNQIQDKSTSINQSPTKISSHESIEFSSVSFSFISREVAVLSNVSLKIKPSCITAIVGKSGSGKSTLMALLCGLYRPTSGNVFLDGININNVDQQWLRSQIGVVEQQAGLLSGTIRDNIAYGKEDASESEIILAAKKAYAHDFIMSFPDGYNTQVGENGSLLSGGQAARIAIARAIVKEPKYLLLDEATASLDQDSENQVVEVLNNLSKNKTTILVFTHSETLMKAAKVCHVLKNGIFIASGSFKEISSNLK
jgi:ABC-type branched-subunit amino acid transport system ATPase component